jgi:hypothetical protein
MAHLTISVPKEHVDDLRRELLRAHGERARELRRALDVYLGSHERLDEVEGALVELVDLDTAIAQLGWTPAAAPRAVELTAHPEVLSDALRELLASAAGASRASLLELARCVERG